MDQANCIGIVKHNSSNVMLSSERYPGKEKDATLLGAVMGASALRSSLGRYLRHKFGITKLALHNTPTCP